MEPKLIKKEPLGNGFYVYVSKRHTFSTDSILLSNFAAARQGDTLIDLGTGCGIIPLLMLRDGRVKSATGVEISNEAAALLKRTKEELSLENFQIIESDLNDLKGKIPYIGNTLITCNPPYKAPGAGLVNPDKTVATARHETACTLEDIIRVTAELLQTAGRLCICHRPERLAELTALMRQYHIEPKRLRLVCHRAGEEPWLVLVEGKKRAKTGLRIAPTLYVEENGRYSDEMLKIYGLYKEEAD